MKQRVLRRLLGAAALVFLLALATFALPVSTWRTGQEDWSAFEPLAPDRRPALPARVWVDTDAACGEGAWRDPDDCLALLAVLTQAGIDVVGISTVFGNAALATTDAVARELVARHVAAGGRAVPVHRGCARALPACSAGQEADRALRAAIAQGPLTILALGPLTNVALALASMPSPGDVHVVAVMGRRPGHRFHPTEGKSSGAMLFGHGPVFSDFNFALDPRAAAAVVGAAVPLTLIPYEAARDVLLGADDLDRIARGGALGAWVVERSRPWFAQWRVSIGLDGFYPFDLVAALYLVAPERFACARVSAWVGRDRKRSIFEWSDALLVAQHEPPDEDAVAKTAVIYCTDVRARVEDVL